MSSYAVAGIKNSKKVILEEVEVIPLDNVTLPMHISIKKNIRIVGDEDYKNFPGVNILFNDG